ncbi:FAD:protein FMN transferase [Shigella flexneri]
MAEIVTTSLRIGAKTDGAMEITVGPLGSLWGLARKKAGSNPEPGTDPRDESQNRPQHQRSSISRISNICKKTCRIIYRSLTVGEGYAADHLARLMEQEGISRHLVSVGGALDSRVRTVKASRGGAYQNQPIKKTRFRPWWISTVMALAPLAAT